MTLQGLSIYSSGDDDKIDGAFCASALCTRILAPHDELAKFFRSLPFFDKPIVDVVCTPFPDDEIPLDELIKVFPDGILLPLLVSSFPVSTKSKSFKIDFY